MTAPAAAFDIGCMPHRGLFPLFVVIAVCLASIAFLPFGAGPYTAVYGPTSALRAQRAVALLWFAIVFLAAIVALAVRVTLVARRPFFAFGTETETAACPVLLALRC